MDLNTRGRGGWGGGSNTMADYCAQCYLQIKPTKCLNVCEWMNMTERTATVLTFDLLSRDSSMLVKEPRMEKLSLILTTITTFSFRSFVL